MLNGMGIFLGAGLGAILIKYLPALSIGVLIKPIATIFIISGILRIFVVLIFLPKIKEVRKVKGLSSRVFKQIILKDLNASFKEEVHDIMSIKDYFES